MIMVDDLHKTGFCLRGQLCRWPTALSDFRVVLPTRSLPVAHSLLCPGERCSTPGPSGVRTTYPSPDCDECHAAFPFSDEQQVPRAKNKALGMTKTCDKDI